MKTEEVVWGAPKDVPTRINKLIPGTKVTFYPDDNGPIWTIVEATGISHAWALVEVKNNFFEYYTDEDELLQHLQLHNAHRVIE